MATCNAGLHDVIVNQVYLENGDIVTLFDVSREGQHADCRERWAFIALLWCDVMSTGNCVHMQAYLM